MLLHQKFNVSLVSDHWPTAKELHSFNLESHNVRLLLYTFSLVLRVSLSLGVGWLVNVYFSLWDMSHSEPECLTRQCRARSLSGPGELSDHRALRRLYHGQAEPTAPWPLTIYVKGQLIDVSRARKLFWASILRSHTTTTESKFCIFGMRCVWSVGIMPPRSAVACHSLMVIDPSLWPLAKLAGSPEAASHHYPSEALWTWQNQAGAFE